VEGVVDLSVESPRGHPPCRRPRCAAAHDGVSERRVAPVAAVGIGALAVRWRGMPPARVPSALSEGAGKVVGLWVPGRRASRNHKIAKLSSPTSWHDVAIRLAFVAVFVACSRVLSRASRALRDWTGQVSCSCVARAAHDVCVRVHCRAILDGAECCVVESHGSIQCIVEAGASCGRQHARPQRRRRAADGRCGVRGGRARPGRRAWAGRWAPYLHVYFT
jgi:hypothetical protein